MQHLPNYPALTTEELKDALALESTEYERSVRWLEAHMPPSFLDETPPKMRLLIARNLLSFKLQNHFICITFPTQEVVLCLDAPDADLRILKNYTDRGIRYYRAFVSNAPPPNSDASLGNLRIATIHFTETLASEEHRLPAHTKEELLTIVRKHHPRVSARDVDNLLHGLSPRFCRSLTSGRLAAALNVFFHAQSSDQCQYEVKQNPDWAEKDAPSLQLTLAWRNVPKAEFLYRLAQIIDVHGLALQKVVAAYVDLPHSENILILSIGLHGKQGRAAWEEADVDDFLRELCLLKYINIDDLVAKALVVPKLLTGNQAHLVRTAISFVHQTLVYVDPNLYSFEQVEEGFLRHPELTAQLYPLFAAKFDPRRNNLDTFQSLRKNFLNRVEQLDTGQAVHDLRRKNVLHQAVSFIDHILKTNFYLPNKSAFSFRLDPNYLNQVPHNRAEKFPEIPYAIFFIRGMHFLGFNIRFRDLARGGVRTVMPEKQEQFLLERNTIFAEAYNLAYTQQKKNKDIPEGGAKTAILLRPFDVYQQEWQIYQREMEQSGIDPVVQKEKLDSYMRDQKLLFLYSSQRSFIESWMPLLNCDEEGKILTPEVIDYWKRPEYIYLGPDENMHNIMIEWIANYASQCKYKPGRSFMSSKPREGINHKEYGVTSYGLNVYVHETLLALGIDPDKQPFTIKISGGPDGDVAGNEILNLARFYSKTAKLLALTDISGTIYDPQGLDLTEMTRLFEKGLPIREYPAEKLSNGGFLLDLRTKREESSYAQQTLCWRKQNGTLQQDWLSGNEMNHLYRTNLHQTKVDIFVPGGGRPRTLNETNVQSFLDEAGVPTARAIVEGANLYLTPGARRFLEQLGVLVLKDSSCNKGGVICSSFEVLAGLCLTSDEFVEHKEAYVKQVLEVIRIAALNEATLMLSTHRKTGGFLTDISEKISEQINLYKDQLLTFLEGEELPDNFDHPFMKSLLSYCPPLLRERYQQRILELPSIHKKAIISCFLASRLVYRRGVEWTPTIADILPTIADML